MWFLGVSPPDFISRGWASQGAGVSQMGWGGYLTYPMMHVIYLPPPPPSHPDEQTHACENIILSHNFVGGR